MAHTPKMTAERWLYLLHQNLRPLFRDSGYPLPGNIEIHCGYPKGKSAAGEFHHNAAAKKRRALSRMTATPAPKPEGPPAAHHVFILPEIDDSVEVAAILVNELIHAAMPPGVHHTSPYQDACRAIGLVVTVNKGQNHCVTEIDDQPDRYVWFNAPRRGAYTQPDNDPPRLSPNGVRLRALLTAAIDRHGPYPHRAIQRRRRAIDAPTPGNPKAHRFKCPECPWTVRIGPVSLSFGVPNCSNPECENYGGECEERRAKT